MTVSTVKAQLAVLQAAIPGIKRAYAQLPRGTIKDMDMPLFLNFARDATHNTQSEIAQPGGSDMVFTSRQYLMQLYVLPIQEGIPQEGEALTEPWIATVLAYFNQRPSLGSLSGVQEAFIIGDSGPRQFVWADTAYWGVEFRLRVVEYVKRTYASNE